MKHQNTITLGFELGTGRRIDIPRQHMVVCGQTQQAGKTTTLEALVSRSASRAVAFVTKRGEQSFSHGYRLPPYFRERADWQFVASVLEATMRERLKFERAWIIRASKGAQSLAEVQTNVRQLAEKARGLSADVYATLDAYLEIVVPRIASVTFAKTVALQPGMNVVDIANRQTFPAELQALVMRSILEWMYEHGDGDITIIPEAWEFVPQGRNSPVKLAAIELIRKGAGLRNHVWLDSQDIGGVDKELLRQCTVWLLGVQRETNEVKRTLDNIPAGIAKPKASELATLEKGQFYACWGRNVFKVYVWPAWMPESEAQVIAMGGHQTTVPPRIEATPEETMTAQQAKQLTDDNQRLREENLSLADQVRSLRDLLQTSQRPAASPATAPEPVAAVHGNGDHSVIAETVVALVLKHPAIIQLRTTRPEIQMHVERRQITVDEKSLKGRIAKLLHGGFFRESRRCGTIRSELARTGPDANTANIGRAMDDLKGEGFVTEEGGGYIQVPDMLVNVIKS